MSRVKKRLGAFIGYMRGVGIGAIALFVIFTLTAVDASAIEIPQGVTEVKIPIELAYSGSIAGAEISFTKTPGLDYLRYEPASGLENPVRRDVADKTWVGFFSAVNKYSSAAGKIAIGNLIFSYAGDATERVKITDVNLHSVTARENVESQKSQPGTDIEVTRRTVSGGDMTGAPEGGGIVVNPGDGPTVVTVGDTSNPNSSADGQSGSANDTTGDKKTSGKDSSNKSGGSKSDSNSSNKSGGSKSGSSNVSAGNTGSVAGTYTGAQTPSATTDSGVDTAMEGDASDSLTARAVGESEMVPFTNDESLKSISDSATPLADAGEARGGQINLLIPFLIAVACIGVLIFLLWRKTRLV